MPVVNPTPVTIGAVSFISNISLAGVKIIVGMAGSSYALIADGIESLADCASSLIVWNGLRVSGQEADHEHPYGHGKAEAVAAFMAGIGLVVSAFIIAWHALAEVFANQTAPATFTIPTLIGIILFKECQFHFTHRGADLHDSPALRAEAWHHRTDSLTSLGVLTGIVIAIVAGPGYAFADDLAALLVTGLILFNAYRIIRPALDELMDRRIEDTQAKTILEHIHRVHGVIDVETLIVRRSGRGYIADVHLEVDPLITVEQGHEIAHQVKDQLLQMEQPTVVHVTTHVEPHSHDR